jgi:hypothetical protein
MLAPARRRPAEPYAITETGVDKFIENDRIGAPGNTGKQSQIGKVTATEKEGGGRAVETRYAVFQLVNTLVVAGNEATAGAEA